MSDDPSKLPDSPALPDAAASPPRRRRTLRRLFFSAGFIALLLAATIVGLFFYASSDSFEALVRKRIVDVLQQSTGGRAEIASFHWHLLSLEAEASGIVLHGTEAPDEAPYATIDHLRASISILGFFSPRILLRDLEVDHPAIHLISYPDGNTNQPQPAHPSKSSGSGIDQLFDLQAHNAAVRDGLFVLDDRTDALNLRRLSMPVNFEAHDVSLRMAWVPPAATTPETYRIEAGATDLRLAHGKPQTFHGFFQASLDLTRTALYLRSLRLTSRERGVPDRTLDISADLQNFANPHWHAKVQGDFDMRLFDPLLDFPNLPAGTLRVDVDAAGDTGEFRADGTGHLENGALVMPGIRLAGMRVDTHVHIDPHQMVFSSVVARFPQGGAITGDFTLSPWLSYFPGEASLSATPAHPRPVRSSTAISHPAPQRHTAPNLPYEPPFIPFNGKINARLKDLSLDAVLDAVSDPPFQRLGFDARLNGPINATFTDGYTATTVVSAQFAIDPTGHPLPGELPASGTFDATYTHRDGSVALRKLLVQLPSSQVQASGLLGVHPMSRVSGINVDFHSTNLNDFDPLLRDLGVSSDGRSGTAALPINLAGQGDFHGTWSGSILDPHIAGSLKTTQIAVEMLPAKQPPNEPAAATQAAPLQAVHWDSIEATGSYSAERIAIDHALLHRGTAEIALDGSLDATPAQSQSRLVEPTFDGNSTLHLHLRAAHVPMDDLLPLLNQSIPVSGTLDTEFHADGKVNALGGSGSAELTAGVVDGEPVSRLQVQGSLTNNLLRLTSVAASLPAGSLAASGTYDLNSHHFQIDAKGDGIDVAKIQSLRQVDDEIAGRLDFTLAGTGTLDDPHIQGHANFSNLTIGGQSLGVLTLQAHSDERAIIYDATSGLEGAELKLHGRTELKDGHPTQARIDFSHFNIAAPLRMAHFRVLNGESSLAGFITVEGPLDHIDQLRGEARLPEMAVTLDGVHLVSQGGFHASLANARIELDPLHVTGEQTDLQAKGTLGIKGDQRLDLSASGTINLKLAETLDSDLTAGGTSTFALEAHGPLKNPSFQGRIDFQNGSLALEDLPNGLSQLHGTLEFNQNRLEVQSLTAMTGGGQLSVGGYLAYQHGLFADLTVTGKSMRIRYPEGVSSLADTSLHLQGTQNSLLLSGDVLITRFSINPDFDIAALAAQANSVTAVAPPDAPSNHIRLDVHLASSPQLNFQNAFAKLAGNVDLHIRGTLASPSLLGNIAITEGSALLAGTRYDLQRGDITFSNPVRIEPSIDLNATARVEDYDITLGLHGTPQKLNVSYRSEPPLPEADVVALLALGRTGNQQRLYTQQQEQEIANPTTDALLGGALNATVSSRVQKLFGAGSVKVDPNYLGALGNSTSRIIVEEQLGRDLTLTYATNVNTTSQQLIQAEVAINRHVSLLVARDESGVFSMVIKATRRYR
jgi:translocation and assembly module TamB